jgi:O-antigen/teichoic acid export membrane protein
MTRSMEHRVVSGSFWTIVGYGSSTLLRLVSSIILWRLLIPEHFGLMALVGVFMQGLQMFSDVGIGPAIIQSRRGHDERFLNTAWTIQGIRGVGLWLAACALAWPVSRFYDDPRLLAVLPVAGLTAVIWGFAATSLHTLNRDLSLGRVVFMELASQGVNIVTMVAWACVWPSVWALVAGTLAGGLCMNILSFRFSTHRHRFVLDRECLHEQFRFGRWVFMSSVCTFLANGADRLILGRLVPSGVLGVYNNALTLAQMPAQLLNNLGARVLFPALASKHREGAFDRAFHRAKTVMVLIAGLPVIGMIGLGPTVIPLLYGPKCAEAGWMVEYLAAGMWFQVLEAVNSKVTFARGDTKWTAAGTFARFVTIAAALPAAFHFWGITGAVACVALSDIPRYVVATIGAVRAGTPAVWADVAATASLAAAVSIGLLLEPHLAPLTGWAAPWLTTAVSCLAWLALRARESLVVLQLVGSRWRLRSVTA